MASLFLTGARETAEQAVHSARRLLRLIKVGRGRIQNLGRSAGSALRVHGHLEGTHARYLDQTRDQS
jgi:hypothetical protein